MSPRDPACLTAQHLQESLEALETVCLQEYDALTYLATDQVSSLHPHKVQLLSSIRRLMQSLENTPDGVPASLRLLAARCRELNRKNQQALNDLVYRLDDQGSEF